MEGWKARVELTQARPASMRGSKMKGVTIKHRVSPSLQQNLAMPSWANVSIEIPFLSCLLYKIEDVRRCPINKWFSRDGM